MRNAFSEKVFSKITQFGASTMKSLVGHHPEYFTSNKFRIIPTDIKEFVNFRLAYCYPNMRSIALKYAIRKAVIEKFGSDGVGNFVSDGAASFLRDKVSLLHHEYSTKPDDKIALEFHEVPIGYKLDNDALALNVFNLCHRINVSEKCQLSDNQLAIRVIDLLFTVYSLSYLLNSAEVINRLSPETPPPGKGVIHLSRDTFQAKQLIFAAIFRIRSGWDKLMFNLVAESFEVKFSKKDGYFKKLGKLKNSDNINAEYHEQLLFLVSRVSSESQDLKPVTWCG